MLSAQLIVVVTPWASLSSPTMLSYTPQNHLAVLSEVNLQLPLTVELHW